MGGVSVVRRLRLWLARWAIGGTTDYLWMEVPYRAAFVILPDDLGAWDEERVNTLNAALEEKVRKQGGYAEREGPRAGA